jgi:hypothetical protein
MRMLPTLVALIVIVALVVLAGWLDTGGLPPELWP